ncbi:MAG: methyl-accepting chemotaxis protein [Pseudomonadota bacterium]
MFRKTSISTNGSMGKTQNNEINEKMLLLIEGLKQGKRAYATKDMLGNETLSAAWNDMVDKVLGDKSDSILSVNNMLGFITDMTYVRNMIEEVRSQNLELHTMAASGQEMSASVDDVSSRAQNVAGLVSDSVEMINNGNRNMKEAFEFIKKSFESVKTVSKDVDDLSENMRHIEEIVDIIKGIAEQTNLLALNAAIEAARAGDQGKGFAVVAGEVKKLAEHTKDSVGSIQGKISALRGKLSEVVTCTDKTANELENGKQLVDGVITYNNRIFESVQKVNEEIIQIAANSEEQTAVTAELAQRVGESSQCAENVLTECDKTGKGIFRLSQLSNELRLSMLNSGNTLSQHEMLEIYKIDHMLWKWRVYNMLLGYEKIDTSSIGSHLDCRLGKWYYGAAKEQFGGDNTFRSMENPHVELHKMAHEAAEAYARRDINAAEKALSSMNEYSAMVVKALDKLKAGLKE